MGDSLPQKHEKFFKTWSLHHEANKLTCSSEAVRTIVFCRVAVPGHLHDRVGSSISLRMPCNKWAAVINHISLCLFSFSQEVWLRICWEFVAHSNEPHHSLDHIFSLGPSTVLCLNWLQIYRQISMKKSQSLPLCYIFVKLDQKSWKTQTLNQRNIPNAHNWP